MKIYFSFCLAFLSTFALYAQSDNCSTATPLSVNSSCVTTAGTSASATQSIAGCTGTADDDVWYEFVATGTSQQIVVTPSASFDAVVQLFSGTCAALISNTCKNDFGVGLAETINATGLTIGNTYKIRVYHFASGAGSGTFTICVTNPPVAPSNDACGGAVTLSVNPSCSYTAGTTVGATQSYTGCSGTADDDVWYKFVATNAVQTITVHPTSTMDAVIQLYSGTGCSTLSAMTCQDNTFNSQDEQLSAVGLIPGQIYYVRVYDYYVGTPGIFQICVTGTATAAPTNDEPCSAIQLPTVTASCVYSQFTTIGATSTVAAPTPSSCVGGSGLQQGGYSATSKDVWFKITVPSSGSIQVTSEPNIGTGAITDGVMALYSGTCGSLTQIACSDDHTLYPGTANDLLPMISASSLTPGSTVYLRYFGYGSSSGLFGICVSTTTNDNCANALYICDINGYSASTSAAYTPDRPDNMRGNNEDINGVNQVDGINTGGIFGQGGSWGTGAPAFDVTINNNSWIKFTASSTSATLDVSIFDCWVGNYPSGGIQMQIFEGNNCTNFVPVSNFMENSTGFTITANNLTIGNNYYLMVDGFAGDICNYTITAQSGVQFPDIANVAPICAGQSVTLTAPSGATSYEWQHNGATTQSVTVTPGTTQSYFCEVSGLCGYKQMLDVTVQVNPLPNVSIAEGSSVSICTGNSTTLTANGASSYSWNTGSTSTSLNVNPTTTTSYTVTGTSLGCTASATTSVVVNALPTLSVNPTSTNSNCGASTGSLNGAVGSGAGTLDYLWTNGSGITIGTTTSVSSLPAGVYNLSITDDNGCVGNFGPFNIINPGAPAAPTIVVDDATPCDLGTVSFSVSSSTSGATFNWTGPNGFISTSNAFVINNISSSDVGNYCVIATSAGCTGPSSCQTITIQTPPNIQIDASGDDSSICLNADFDLLASGGTNYSWSGPNSFTSTNSTISFTNSTNLLAGYFYLSGTDVNGCSGEDSILISIFNLPNLTLNSSANNDVYCLNAIVSLSSNGANSYNWSGPNGFTSSIANPVIPNASAINEGWYVLTGTDLETCANQDSIYVRIITSVPADGTPSDTLLCPGTPVTFYASGGSSYSWSGPNSFTSTAQNPTIESTTIEETGWYTVTVIDTNGCVGFDSTYILVENNKNCLFIPDLITPDFDNHNDNWVIPGIENFDKAVVQIFNRWGNLIYYSSPYNNDWNGQVNRGATIDGKDGKVPVGTYFYIIELNEGENTTYKGYIDVQY